MPCYSNELISAIKRTAIQAVKLDIVQIPSKDNEHTAIVQTEATTKNGQFSGIGSATPANINGSTDPQALFDVAINKSIARSVAIPYLAAQQPTNSPVIEAQFTSSQNPQKIMLTQGQSNGQPEYNHSKKKPMSDKQRNYIESMAMQKHIDPNGLAYEKFNRPLNQLSSFEADAMIRKLQNS